MDSGESAGDDGELALAIARGDDTAEAVLYERFGARVRFLARRGLRSPDLADDASSETFLRVVRAIRAGRLRSPESLAAFVLQTTRHVIYELGRRRQRERGFLDDEQLESIPAAGQDEPPDEDVLAAVRRTIASLTQRDRMFLRMLYYDELPKTEIARRLGIDADRVRLIKSRALQRFRAEFLRRSTERS